MSESLHQSRYIVGIDLGTTNSACCYYDTYQEQHQGEILPIQQLTAAGEIGKPSLLPSFCYLYGAELATGAADLPWRNEPDHIVGVFARDQGASIPSQLVSSAKSWLSHAGVDRESAILPWGSNVEQKISPLEASARYLRHMRDAWNHVFGRTRDRDGSPCLLEQQQVVVTIPASFDETARDLTLRAAREAGLRDVQLLEEPLAAFYSWLNGHEQDWKEQIQPGERVLVVDIGGGTTDFSIVELERGNTLRRFAVGEHLLLGGDNIDIALARTFEQQWSGKLRSAEWSQLVQLCRAAKEQILEGTCEEIPITLLGRGSSLLGSARSGILTRETVLSVLLDGFYPLVAHDHPSPAQGGMRQMGLPYATEPAVTSHLLAFLRHAARVANDDQPVAYPSKVLFNGGSMIPQVLRDRVLAALSAWFPDREKPTELTGNYALAVATGAAYYGRVRRGEGVKVRGGIAHAYYTEVAGPSGPEVVCLMPRDTEEGRPVEVPGTFAVRTNQSVRFPLYSSATRLADQAGQHIAERDELTLVAPLVSVLQYGRTEERDLKVSLYSELNEIGALEVSLQSVETQHRWPLRFDLRPTQPTDTTQPNTAQAGIVHDADAIESAKSYLRAGFADGKGLAKLIPGLEELLQSSRADWNVSSLRALADCLLDMRDQTARSAHIEARWLNLLGYCLRPGFGDPEDLLRIRKIWPMWFDGLKYDRDPQAAAEWWVFWRRVAAGLKAGHQSTIAGVAGKVLAPKGKFRESIREGEQARREMWRCLGAMEWLPLATKQRFANILMKRDQLNAFELWVMARIGARSLFHGPENLIVPAPMAAQWAAGLLGMQVPEDARSMRDFALARLVQPCGDRSLDVDETTRQRVIEWLKSHDRPTTWIHSDQSKQDPSAPELTKILADSLPLGLSRSE